MGADENLLDYERDATDPDMDVEKIGVHQSDLIDGVSLIEVGRIFTFGLTDFSLDFWSAV